MDWSSSVDTMIESPSNTVPVDSSSRGSKKLSVVFDYTNFVL